MYVEFGVPVGPVSRGDYTSLKNIDSLHTRVSVRFEGRGREPGPRGREGAQGPGRYEQIIIVLKKYRYFRAAPYWAAIHTL